MKSKKKNSEISISGVVNQYGGDKKYCYPLSILISSFSGIVAVIPYYFVWKIAMELITSDHVNIRLIKTYALWIFISQVIGILTGLLSQAFSHLLAFRVEKNIRKRAVSHLMKLSIGYFENEDSGRIRRKIDDNASKTHSFIAHIMPDMASVVVVPILMIVFILVVDIKLGIICLLGIAFAMASMSMMMGPKTKKLMEEYMTTSENLGISGVEFIRGMPVVKVFNQTIESFQKFYSVIMDYDEKVKFFVNYCKLPMTLYTLALYLPTILIGPITIILINGADQPLKLLTDSILYIIISMNLHSSLMRLATLSESRNQFAVTIQKLDTIFDLDPIKEFDYDKKDESGIVFDQVTYTYPGKDTPALSNISIHFEKNKTYALVGESGSGKSTLLNLIGRFYDIDKGQIRLNGVNIKSIKESELMSKLAIVFQENKLLKMSLRENICMGRDYSDAEITSAIEASSCQNILARMDNGLDTIIGQKGTYISGGEAQRISIARAFLKDAPILLLDEATAFADPENENKILKSLEILKANRTTIMIAHRLNSIKNVDEIIVMKKGQILDKGKHDYLIDNCAYYKDLYKNYSKSIEWRV